jgi:hypothetical protein
MALTLTRTSALNLELEGTTGSFRVGALDGANATLEVLYFLTHVSLDFETGASSQVLSHLAPVREIFETEQLEFDEIMQRDIDDARVSSELIPYLLDAMSRDLVKLFPPIVVVVLPIKPMENRPADKYPRVTREVDDSPDGHQVRRTRSGAVGAEVFEFHQPIVDGNIRNHDLNRLKLNVNRARMVIVDGQHRAMALLAVYRNLMQDWAHARRAPYKDFYEQWTPSFIKKFDLKEISLPVMFCTFPTIDEEYSGGYDLKKAARAVFLTLNKTARKVSDSRNRLLDDNDLVALLLRSTLSSLKKRDALSQGSMRIFNVELDQAGDRERIKSAIAVTGVSHIYYMIEHLLLNRPTDVVGVRARSGQFATRRDLASYGAFQRLNAGHVLGAALANATDRSFFSREAGDKLAEEWKKTYGASIETFFVKFAPIECHARASLSLEQELLTQDNRKLRPILFDGQGMLRVFYAHRDNIREQLSDNTFGAEPTKIEEVMKNLDATEALVRQSVEWFKAQRAANFVGQLSDRGKVLDGEKVQPKIIEFVSDLFGNVFTTVAFQTAVLASFYRVLETATLDASEAGETAPDGAAEFDRCITCLNSFFIPTTSARLKKLVEVFVGKLDGDLKDWKIAKTNNTFREIVHPAEMQPDQWPKYKFLILEIWQPQSETVKRVLKGERDLARSQVYKSLEDRRKVEFLKQAAKVEDDLSAEERKTLRKDAYASFRQLMLNLGLQSQDVPPVAELIAEQEEGSSSAAAADVDEVWQSAENADENQASSLTAKDVP